MGLIAKKRTVEEWRTVFNVMAGIYFFSAIFYAVFASGKVQPWAREPEKQPLIGNEQPSLAIPALFILNPEERN